MMSSARFNPTSALQGHCMMSKDRARLAPLRPHLIPLTMSAIFNQALVSWDSTQWFKDAQPALLFFPFEESEKICNEAQKALKKLALLWNCSIYFNFALIYNCSFKIHNNGVSYLKEEFRGLYHPVSVRKPHNISRG